MKLSITIFAFITFPIVYWAQETDTLRNERFSIHAQATVINQTKLKFKANYSGINSLKTNQENQTSITSTLYAGVRLWKGASVFVNPEIAGGSGLSEALGVANATNGETFRIGDPSPKIYVARIFYRQLFALSKAVVYQQSDENQLGGYIPEKYIGITVGKIGVADYFDDNEFSHDPRTQFMSWGLMDNSAWDYPANTRGYTPSVVLEYVTPKNEIRYGLSLVPLVANGPTMNWNLGKANSSTLEYTHRHQINGQNGAVRVLVFFTTTDMGNYRQSVAENPSVPVISDTRKYGRTKYGIGVSAGQHITKDIGCFLRASWNDGNNETWAFTEVDHTVSAGFSMNGERYKRPNDNIGIAYVVAGISKPHRDYLKAGGDGFMLGDGNLNYSAEHLGEVYYSVALLKSNIFLTGTYQLLVNPGYNKDRQGPVNIFSLRFHANI